MWPGRWLFNEKKNTKEFATFQRAFPSTEVPTSRQIILLRHSLDARNAKPSILDAKNVIFLEKKLAKKTGY